MLNKLPIGGVIHTYQKYDPLTFPSPSQPPPDLLSPAFEHLLMYGSLRRFSEEELAQAIQLDPSQIAGLGPSLESLIAMLKERKRKILERYETGTVRKRASAEFRDLAEEIRPPDKFHKSYRKAIRDEQLHDLEQIWYRLGDDRSEFAGDLVQLLEALGAKYQVDELASQYEFTGREAMTIPQSLEVKQELETIDKLLKQLEEAAKTAQLGVIDMDALSQYADQQQLDELGQLQRQVEEYLRHLAEQQGLERNAKGFQLAPQAYRVFQGKLLEKIFSQLEASRSGRHQGPILGEGAVELQQTKSYEFGDSIANMDMPQTIINALIRNGPGLPVRIKQDDIEIHRTRNNPKCATVVLMDMSGSMRYDGQYINVKRMGLALEGLIRREYPGDFVQFIEMFTFAKPRAVGEIAQLLPKPVTIFDPVVRLWADMSQPDISEMEIPPHFTNIQHGLQMSRRFLANQDTPNKQIILITDGLPTAHFEGEKLYLMYPPHPRTEQATLREGLSCARDGITINIFLLSTWSQSSEDIQFAYKLAESTRGRVFFTAGRDLDRYVVWDYVNRRREIVG